MRNCFPRDVYFDFDMGLAEKSDLFGPFQSKSGCSHTFDTLSSENIRSTKIDFSKICSFSKHEIKKIFLEISRLSIMELERTTKTV